jgi:hypothetical protein
MVLFAKFPLKKFTDSLLATKLNALSVGYKVSAVELAEAIRSHSQTPLPADVQKEIERLVSVSGTPTSNC